nr:Lrp/AsnC family transcriptional regulator [Pseudomonas brassicacearum subsp. brassicacearum]
MQLAEEIGLSPSPCLRRVRMLEEAGVIRGYQAVLDRDEVGLGLTIFVGVKVERHNDERAEAFRQAVTALPEVISAFLVSGESDFLLQVVVPDLRAYDRFVTGHLLKLPGISDIRSNFAINTVKTPGGVAVGAFAWG